MESVTDDEVYFFTQLDKNPNFSEKCSHPRKGSILDEWLQINEIIRGQHGNGIAMYSYFLLL